MRPFLLRILFNKVLREYENAEKEIIDEYYTDKEEELEKLKLKIENYKNEFDKIIMID